MPMLDEDLDRCRELFEMNVWGAVRVTQGFVPLVIRARGVVVSVGSVAGRVNTPYMGIYGASKKSLEVISDTLRLELVPFGVRVLSVITGSVQSQGISYFDDLKLPEESLYKRVEGSVVARAKWEDGVPRKATGGCAERVVKHITAGATGATGAIWEGKAAGTIWLLEKFMSMWIMDKLFMMGTGLDKLWMKKT